MKNTELVRHAKAEIRRLEIHITKLNQAIFKAMAEKKAYENLIEWSEKTNGSKSKSSSNKT